MRPMSVQWTPALAVGHAGIDEQHEELFRRVDSLIESMARGDRTEIGRLFEFLGSYVVEHFAAEERLMAGADFPGYGVHKAAHERFVRDLGELQRLWYSSDVGTDAIAVKARTWIADWLRTHIARTDQALANYLRAPAV
jgi:hemerythrin